MEGAENALLTMATYIDLNAVRAGLCEDPKDYRWCGYGEAMGGEEAARVGLNACRKSWGAARIGGWCIGCVPDVVVRGGSGEQGLDADGAAVKAGFSR